MKTRSKVGIVIGLIIICLLLVFGWYWIFKSGFGEKTIYDKVSLKVGGDIEYVQVSSTVPLHYLIGFVGGVVETPIEIKSVDGEVLGTSRFAYIHMYFGKDRKIKKAIVPLIVQNNDGKLIMTGSNWNNEVASGDWNSISEERIKENLRKLFRIGKILTLTCLVSTDDFSDFVQISEQIVGKPIEWESNAGMSIRLSGDYLMDREVVDLENDIMQKLLVIPISFGSDLRDEDLSIEINKWTSFLINRYR